MAKFNPKEVYPLLRMGDAKQAGTVEIVEVAYFDEEVEILTTNSSTKYTTVGVVTYILHTKRNKPVPHKRDITRYYPYGVYKNEWFEATVRNYYLIEAGKNLIGAQKDEN